VQAVRTTYASVNYPTLSVASQPKQTALCHSHTKGRVRVKDLSRGQQTWSPAGSSSVEALERPEMSATDSRAVKDGERASTRDSESSRSLVV